MAWSSEHVPGGSVRWICPDCTRTRLPDIETMLPTSAHPAAGLDAVA